MIMNLIATRNIKMYMHRPHFQDGNLFHLSVKSQSGSDPTTSTPLNYFTLLENVFLT